ncbi:unnamed protein product [Phaeothamnion confervicola]
MILRMMPSLASPRVLLAMMTVYVASAVTVPTGWPEGTSPWRRTDDGPESGGGGSGNKVFAVPAFFLVFREVVEAVIIISVALQLCERMGRHELKKQVWLGSFAGLLAAGVIAVGFIVAFYAFKREFEGDSESIFEGFMMIAACIIISFLAVSMLSVSRMREKWERKIAAELEAAEAAKAAGEKRGWNAFRGRSMFWIPFTAVLREGVETLVFLAGVQAGYPASSLPLSTIMGALCGIVFGWIIFRAGQKGSLQTFLTFSTVLLLFISAGLLSRGIGSWTAAGWFGATPLETGSDVDKNGDPLPKILRPAWNICDCCSTSNEFFSLAAAFVGYTCAPTGLQILFWCSYWVVVPTLMCYKMKALCFRRLGGAAAAAEADGLETGGFSPEEGRNKSVAVVGGSVTAASHYESKQGDAEAPACAV